MTVPQNLLVTGGCGFLGSNIASHFLEAGATVTVIDALFRTGGEANLAWLRSKDARNALTFVHGDLADEQMVGDVFRKQGPFDYVCHLGGQVAMTTSLSDPSRDMKTNVVGTFNVLEAVRHFSPEALMAYSSTNKVYGDLEELDYVEGEDRYGVPSHQEGFDESLRLDFASPYGCSKGAADQYVRDWYRNFGVKTVVFRHSSIFGGRQFSSFDQGWIGWFCTQAQKQADAMARGENIEPFTIAGNGKQVRDVLHAEDLVRLYSTAFERRDAVAGEIFNIGGGIKNSLSLLELFKALQAKLQLDHPLKFERLPPRQSDQKFFVADITKASDVLGWEPTVSCDEGLSRMLNWVTQNGV
ncbi:SDR family NAD(P)-dependent oxidoreductase [Haloferula sargassicola]|uniref:CDP-paratose 2-epimerase n=1 Tax=Haloferula sargassicola TaxID=490096 RepID=A0ABP9USG4_9BACT